LIGVLLYIAEAAAREFRIRYRSIESAMAVAHDDDLQLIERMVGGDAVQNLLRENEIPVLLENGGMCPVTLQGIPGGAEYYFRISIVMMLQYRDTDRSISTENLTR